MQDRLTARLEKFARDSREPYQLGRLLAALASPFGADDSVPEFFDCLPELTARGLPGDGRTAIVPLGELARALSVGTPSAGGNTAGAKSVQVAETLRQFSVLADAGARVVNLEAGALGIASFSTPLSAAWLENEGDAVSESDPVFALANGTPKMLATPPLDVSRKMLKQAAGIEDALRTEILSAIGRALDAAAINGSGSAGQPTGLLNTAGTIAGTGANITHGNAAAMLRDVLAAGVRRERVRWFAGAQASYLLATRQQDSDSGNAINYFDCCGVPLDVVQGAPTDSLVLMDAADVALVLWGGLVVRTNPYANGTTGAVRFDCMVGADVVVPYPGRIAVATSIT